MPKRSVDWNETLAEKLSDLDFARDFLSDLIDEGDSLQEALGKTIRVVTVLKSFVPLLI